MSASTSLPGKAVWSVAVASTGNHTGDLAGSTKTKPIFVYGKPFSMTLVWAGTPTGTITIYASSNWDPMDPAAAADNWNGTWNSINSTLTTAITQPAGSGGSYELSSNDFVAKAIYIDYARSAGTGTFTVDYNTSV